MAPLRFLPLKDESVARKAYSLTPNHDTLRDYLRECGSAGFELQDATKYQGLITVISRASRGPAPPRTALDPNWRGGGRFFFSARDMHVLRLQRNANWLPIANEFLIAAPAPQIAHKSIADYMDSYHDDNNTYLTTGGVTETDLLRASYVAFSIGTGIVVDVDSAEQNPLQEAPLTRNGRLGLPMFAAGGSKDGTTPKRIQIFQTMGQNTVVELFISGIATHLTGTFEKISLSQTDKVTFKETSKDPQTGKETFKDHEKKEGEQIVKEIDDGVPEYGKSGYFKTKEGKPINAFDAGMGGWGTKVQGKTVGAKWSGLTNSHYTATV
ncbi:hypothetical protein BGZ65_010586 [Modicella reniformis]|uniref:Uncharacterized protein n=1 Tax=Modicella reniformis TaxID=1440133 RepID=A0A9P6SNV4_9FUNG|nr:hypothetical protein BGZ65_010586 [Modicella reniformis]